MLHSFISLANRTICFRPALYIGGFSCVVVDVFFLGGFALAICYGLCRGMH